MDEKKTKKYLQGPGFHKVVVFSIINFHKFFCISCDNCIFHQDCHEVRHKREICVAAKETTKRLKHFTIGHVHGFIEDEFYVSENPKERDWLNSTLYKIQQKYISDQNVRD
nr:hypothetical protein [Candidatus Enterousia merdequi]